MDRLLFSQRKKIAGEAVEWLRKNGGAINDPTNIITALQAIGYRIIKETEIKK